MKVLLLGGAGFIGCNIARCLLAKSNCDITIADNFFRHGGKPDEQIEELNKSGVKLVSADFTCPKSFQQLNEQFDRVYMLASVVGVDHVNSMPHEIIRINTMLILNTLEWLKQVGCGRVLFTSTSEAYAGAVEEFNYEVPTSEEVPLTISDISHPRFTYAVTKMLGESGFLNYSKKLGFEAVIVRFHNVFGPRMGFKHVIPHLVQRFLAGESPFKIYGHDQTRSFNYIDDAIEGTLLAMENGSSGEIYHIGDSTEITIEQLVKFVGDQFEYGGVYEFAPTYPGSVSRRCPDITKANHELGYFPKVEWRDGVKATVNWYKAYLKNNLTLHESFYDRSPKT
jgi:nucleoside-diphosphate-sugar epimerase